jgi:hypothetical protein
MGAIVMVSVAVTGAAERAGRPTSEHAALTTQFDRLIAQRVDAALAQPISNARGRIAWGDSYTLAALAEMLDATRDPRYAASFVKLADHVADARDDRHGRRDEYRNRVVPAWGSSKYTDGKWHVWAVHTGMIAAPMARFAAIVRRDASLRLRFGEDAARILKVAEQAVAVHEDEYRDGPGPDEAYLYGLHTGRNLPLNMQNALASAWIYLDDANGLPQHRERVARLARFFRNRLRTSEDGAYVWAYRPPPDRPDLSFEDVSHASINVAFATLCFEHHIVFTREDITRFEKTLRMHVLRGDGTVANNVGGRGGTDKYPGAALRWGCLARHNPAIREELLRFYESGKVSEVEVSPLGLAYLITTADRTPATRPATRNAPEQH